MSKTAASHESFEREDDTKVGSERSFGFVFAVVFAIIAAINWWVGGRWVWHALAIGAAFAVIAIVVPRILRPLNLLWFKFGLLLHHVISPVILGLMFFTVFTPIGWWMRLVGKRPLNLRFDRAATSYWVERKPPGPPPDSFNNQF